MISVLVPDTNGIDIDPVCKKPIQPRRFCRNGMLVSAQYQGQMAETLNAIARYRTKEYFRAAIDLVGTSSTTLPTTATAYRFAGMIGPMAGTMVARIVMAPAIQATATNNPKVSLAIYDTSGNVLTSGYAHWGTSYGNTPAETPEEFGVATIAIDVSAYQDTLFRAQLSASQEARMISCTVYEVAVPPDTANGYVRQQYSVNAPILDTDRGDLQTLAVALYKRGGPSLIQFSSITDASAPTNNATYRNVLYNASYPSETPPGYTLDLRGCNRKTTTTVPVRIDCYAGSASGNVRLSDTAGNVYATFALTSASPAWQTALTANLPADLRTYVIDHSGAGTTTTTYAVSVYRYQT